MSTGRFKVLVSGNHDWLFEKDYSLAKNLCQYNNITYLEDSEATLGGLRIYGTPWQPWFYDWAFNLPRLGNELHDKWAKIPIGTDILITHGPPNGYGDLVNNWRQPNVNVGCELLLNRIKCNSCGDVITSKHVHNFVTCKCGNCSTDGGTT